MYNVYYMNQFVRSFATRASALNYIVCAPVGQAYADFEILDGSDA